MVLRTATPVVYVILLGIFERLAGPSWAGLLSTFPSLSLVVLVVTYLEAGPGESSRVAQVLPCGNLSTLAFLAVFRLVCEEAGVGWATAAGYGAALAALVVIQRFSSLIEAARARAIGIQPKPCARADRVAERSGSGSVAQGAARSIAGGSRSWSESRGTCRDGWGGGVGFCRWLRRWRGEDLRTDLRITALGWGALPASRSWPRSPSGPG